MARDHADLDTIVILLNIAILLVTKPEVAFAD
jgi:hypothetical protein